MTFKLTDPPEDKRRKELWLQHAAGFLLFQNVRQYALDLIPSDVDQETRDHVVNGIDDAVYGMMMVLDGVIGKGLSNEKFDVSIESKIVLRGEDGEVVQELETLRSDGMCMGYHMWLEGDFGEDKIVTESSS